MLNLDAYINFHSQFKYITNDVIKELHSPISSYLRASLANGIVEGVLILQVDAFWLKDPKVAKSWVKITLGAIVLQGFSAF